MHNAYEVLGLDFLQISEISVRDIKQAYRSSLLIHHPDKSTPLTADIQEHSPGSSIDEIKNAYKTLSNPKLRAELDRQLLLHTSHSLPNLSKKNLQGSTESSHPGLETFDLDDMLFDEERKVWHKSCRCGDTAGYALEEQMLEAESDVGEVLIGCKGCSLWIKVIFGVVET